MIILSISVCVIVFCIFKMIENTKHTNDEIKKYKDEIDKK